MKLETPGGVGTHVYMLEPSGKKYKQFQLLNQEFTFDVDMSSLPCGSNDALYFSKMDADGGTSASRSTLRALLTARVTVMLSA